MFDRQELCARRCVRRLIEIIEQVPARWAARGPMVLDESSVGLLLLWSFIRWERRFPLTSLEEMGVDMWALTRDVDQLLENKRIQKSGENIVERVNESNDANPTLLLRVLTDRWLKRAEHQSRNLGHSFLGAEHLLLALAAGDDSLLQPLFTRYEMSHERLKNAVVEALASKTGQAPDAAIEAILLPPSKEDNSAAQRAVPWGAAWDRKPAVGMTRRFSMAVLMMMVALFAVIFSTLRWINAEPIYYVLFGVLVFGVAIGQMFLFGGKYPRAASVWSGAAILPLEIGVLCLFIPGLPFIMRCFIAVIYMIFAVPIGALCGYLAGGLAAGVVLLLERKKGEEPLAADGPDL